MEKRDLMTRGLPVIVFSQVVFIAIAYALQIYLGKTLQPSEFGLIGVLIGINNINYNFLSQGLRQGVSKALSEDKYNPKDIIKKSFVIQSVIIIFLFSINFFAADLIALVLNKPESASYIRILAFIVPVTAGYFFCLGIANGFQFFIVEAFVMVLYSVLRLSVIPYIGFVFADSVIGVLASILTSGVFCSVACVLLVFNIFKTNASSKPKISYGRIFSYIINFIVFFLCNSITLSLDMFFINATAEDSNLVGYYTGAADLAKISYFIVNAVCFVALPAITRTYNKNNLTECNKIIKNFFLLIVLFVLPIPIISAPFAGNLLAGFFKPEYRIAALSAGVLIFAQFITGIFVLLNIFLSATANRRYSTFTAILTLVIQLLMCFVLVPRFSLVGAAVSTLIAGCAGCLITLVKIKNVFAGLWNKTLTQLTVSNFVLMLMLIFLSKYIYTDKIIFAFFICAAVYVLFILSIWVLRIASPVKLILSIKNRNG